MDDVLRVKDNHKRLKQDIEENILDESLQKNMDTKKVSKKNRKRIEYRKTFTTPS